MTLNSKFSFLMHESQQKLSKTIFEFRVEQVSSQTRQVGIFISLCGVGIRQELVGRYRYGRAGERIKRVSISLCGAFCPENSVFLIYLLAKFCHYVRLWNPNVRLFQSDAQHCKKVIIYLPSYTYLSVIYKLQVQVSIPTTTIIMKRVGRYRQVGWSDINVNAPGPRLVEIR